MNFSNAMLYFLPLFHDLLFPFLWLGCAYVAFGLLGSAFSNLNSLSRGQEALLTVKSGTIIMHL